MTTKEEWLEHFESENARKPTLQEFTEAMKTGKIANPSLIADSSQFVQSEKIAFPDKKINQLSLFKLGCFGAVISTLTSVVSGILGLTLFGSISSAIGSLFAGLSGIMTAAKVIGIIVLLLGIAWTWFTVFRLKSQQFKGWAIYFLVIGIISALRAVYGLITSLGYLSSYYSELISVLGAKYVVYLIWSVISPLISVGVSAIWIVIFAKSRKIK